MADTRKLSEEELKLISGGTDTSEEQTDKPKEKTEKNSLEKILSGEGPTHIGDVPGHH